VPLCSRLLDTRDCQHIEKGRIFNFSNILIKRQGLFAMKGFHDIYKEFFPTDTFEDLKIPLYVTATDILESWFTFRQEIYPNR
jgi:predicted acylesterase/phospholipase RssA